MPNIIHCPSCRRELRVPAELVGKKVKCPSCGVIFTASLEPEAGQEAPIILEEESPAEPAQPQQPVPPAPSEGRFPEQPQPGYGDEVGYARQFREQNLSPVKAPAICLLITGLLGIMCNCVSLLRIATADPQAMKQKLAELPPEWQQALKDFPVEDVINFAKSPAGIAYRFVFIAISLVLVVSAIAMMAGKMYWLAIIGSILAMLNIESCCCVLGLPFGIWSLVVLSRPDVKSAFK